MTFRITNQSVDPIHISLSEKLTPSKKTEDSCLNSQSWTLESNRTFTLYESKSSLLKKYISELINGSDGVPFKSWTGYNEPRKSSFTNITTCQFEMNISRLIKGTLENPKKEEKFPFLNLTLVKPKGEPYTCAMTIQDRIYKEIPKHYIQPLRFRIGTEVLFSTDSKKECILTPEKGSPIELKCPSLKATLLPEKLPSRSLLSFPNNKKSIFGKLCKQQKDITEFVFVQNSSIDPFNLVMTFPFRQVCQIVPPDEVVEIPKILDPTNRMPWTLKVCRVATEKVFRNGVCNSPCFRFEFNPQRKEDHSHRFVIKDMVNTKMPTGNSSFWMKTNIGLRRYPSKKTTNSNSKPDITCTFLEEEKYMCSASRLPKKYSLKKEAT